jgi:hypothetical protein
MLDEVTKQNAEVGRRATEQQIKRSEQEAELAKSRIEREQLGIAADSWEPGEDLTTQPQEIRDLAKKYGITRGRPETGGIGLPGGIPAAAGGMMGPDPADHNEYYKGSREDRERDRKAALGEKFRRQLASAQSVPEQVGILMEAEANGINLDSGTYGAVTREHKQPRGRFVIDPDTGKVTRATAADGYELTDQDDVTVLPRDARPPKESRPQFIDRPVIGPDGKPDPTKMYVMTDRGLEVVNAPNGLRIGDKPKTGGGGSGNSTVYVPAGLRNKVADLRMKASKGDKGASDGLMQAQQNLISDQLQRGLITPDVAETIRDVINKTLNVTPQTWMQYLTRQPGPAVPTIDEIIATYSSDVGTPTGFTPEELEQFKDLLAHIY